VELEVVAREAAELVALVGQAAGELRPLAARLLLPENG
jgi:hypothetical protein